MYIDKRKNMISTCYHARVVTS